MIKQIQGWLYIPADGSVTPAPVLHPIPTLVIEGAHGFRVRVEDVFVVVGVGDRDA